MRGTPLHQLYQLSRMIHSGLGVLIAHNIPVLSHQPQRDFRRQVIAGAIREIIQVDGLLRKRLRNPGIIRFQPFRAQREIIRRQEDDCIRAFFPGKTGQRKQFLKTMLVDPTISCVLCAILSTANRISSFSVP